MPDQLTIKIIDSSDPQYGGLVVICLDCNCTSYSHKGDMQTIYALDEKGKKAQPYYAEIKSYDTKAGKPVCAGVFSRIPRGNYGICRPWSKDWSDYSSSSKVITVFPGDVVYVEMKY